VVAVAFEIMYGSSRPINDIFIYMAQAFERVLAVAFGKRNVGSIPTPGLFLYVAPAVEPVLAVAFETHDTYKRQTSMPQWDSNTQSQLARSRRPTIGIFLYLSLRLKRCTDEKC